jgi:argininosuccinate synthase
MKNTKYTKVASYEAHKGSFSKCLLLYSGGLDTSVMLKWIQQEYKCEVVALTLNIGQTADDLEEIKQKALNLGASDAIVYDAREEFASNQLAMAIKANADYQGGYALSTPLGRVSISQVAVKIAKQYGCEVVAHGCTGKGNDQVRFESYILTLNPKIKIIAPVREWSMGRQEEIEYAKKHNIPVKQSSKKPYSFDENMWGNTAEGGEIEDPGEKPNTSEILQWCNTIENTPDTAETVKIDFKEGIPFAVNDTAMPLASIVSECNRLGAKHGIGVVHLIEDRIVGLKVRGIYENPGASLLISAHKKLEQLVSTRQENELKSFMDSKWAYLVYAAQWFEPTTQHLQAYIDNQNKKVTGSVTVELYKGNTTVFSLESPYSLFDHNLATFEKNKAFNQNASSGFTEIYNLPQMSAYGVFNYEQ